MRRWKPRGGVLNFFFRQGVVTAGGKFLGGRERLCASGKFAMG